MQYLSTVTPENQFINSVSLLNAEHSLPEPYGLRLYSRSHLLFKLLLHEFCFSFAEPRVFPGVGGGLGGGLGGDPLSRLLSPPSRPCPYHKNLQKTVGKTITHCS